MTGFWDWVAGDVWSLGGWGLGVLRFGGLVVVWCRGFGLLWLSRCAGFVVFWVAGVVVLMFSSLGC